MYRGLRFMGDVAKVRKIGSEVMEFVILGKSSSQKWGQNHRAVPKYFDTTLLV